MGSGGSGFLKWCQGCARAAAGHFPLLIRDAEFMNQGASLPGMVDGIKWLWRQR